VAFKSCQIAHSNAGKVHAVSLETGARAHVSAVRAAPRMSATARPRDALPRRTHAENHFRICEDLTNQKARVIGRE
jgi:hypothetical protein